MAPKSTPLLFLILSIILVIQVSAKVDIAASPKAAVGGWKDIKNLKDPKVVEIAKFAVDANNKKANGVQLTFDSIIKGQYQIVSGIKYNLVIAAKSSTGSGASQPPHEYLAVVYDKAGQKTHQLVSFTAEKSS